MKLINQSYLGSDNRLSLIDLQITPDFNGHLLVFVHGYMGYKDWGAWNLMEEFFVSRNFGFCKFNLSHNGGTIQNGIDFPDLEAFAQNTYSKEKADVGFALDWLENTMKKLPAIHLIGHSRGGGMALLNAADKRVFSVSTLAAISSVAKRFRDEKMLEDWKKDGIRYGTNQRTKQQMPHDYVQVTDFLSHQSELDICAACKKNEKPVLLIHGTQDLSIHLEEGLELAQCCKTKLTVIENTDHVFGASQPWTNTELPPKLKEACENILSFLEKHFLKL